MISSRLQTTNNLLKGRLLTYSVRTGLATSAQRIQAQNVENLKVFRENASKWWTGKEFALLRSMNEIRIPFIENGLDKPMKESKILDIGCGGGILSEPLARLGASVLGIDPVYESINEAQIHAQSDDSLKNCLTYRACNIEDISPSPEHVEAYDAVVASEVLEHIEDVEQFLKHCTKLLKPQGSLFITTINQTPLSWLGVIFFGEYVLQQLPKGTHKYNLFVNVKGLRIMLERLGYHVKLINGFMYEPVLGRFYWTPTTLTHYALQAVKLPTTVKNHFINYEQRRNKPKSSKKVDRPKRPLEKGEMMQVFDVDSYYSKSDAIIADFKEQLEKRLTTRNTVESFDTLKIDIEGSNEPFDLRDIAQIYTKGSNLIIIELSAMPEAVKPVMAALTSIGIVNPQIQTNTIYVSLPKVTREHREKIAAAAKQAANKAKSQFKQLYSETCSKIEIGKGKGVSDDLIFDTKENMRFDIDNRTQMIDSLLESKINLLLNKS